MKNFIENILDWVYRKKCYFCGNSKENSRMCSNCYDEMQNFDYATTRVIDGVKVYCAGIYEEKIQKLIRGVKYHNQKELAYFQAKFMYEYWKNITDKPYTVIPIPMSSSRKKSRKYNHMDLVASEFCKLSGYTLNTDLVERIKDTKPQYKLNKTERMLNLKGAFRIKTKISGGIMLLDDICTTGSTFENIIQELKKSGMNDIVCLATSTPFSN